jgi:hypothetical protein
MIYQGLARGIISAREPRILLLIVSGQNNFIASLDQIEKPNNAV